MYKLLSVYHSIGGTTCSSEEVIESDYKTLLLSMLSDYINSCESIKKAVGNDGTSGGKGASPSQPSESQSNTCSTGTSSTPSSTCASPINTPSCTATGATQTSNCQQTPAAQTETNQCNSGQQQTQTQAAPTQSTNGCSFKKLCEKVNNNTCKVLKEIKEYKDCNNICVNSDENCKDFIRKTMEHCEKEAKCLIMQLNEDLSPELVNTIVLRFIGLQLYLRLIQEFSLLREYFTNIIENLSTCDAIKSCNCGTGDRCCSVEGKCLCTIFYKLFIATKSLHNRYCKIIGYMGGESDEDLYKVIPSLSLTRSMYLLTSYFNDYINSDYMVEESSCGCGYNVYVEPSLIGQITDFAAETVLWLVSKIAKAEYTGLKTCTCHRYSSKLDDVVTLLQTGLDDTDDCDGLLSDVISMISPLVKVEDCRSVALKTEPSTNIAKTNKDAIDKQLKEVIEKKNGLDGVIQGIKNESSCDGKPDSSGGETSNGAGCASCENAQATSAGSQPTANNGCSGTNGGTDINTACSQYMNGGTGTCTQSDSTQCTCGCAACTSGKAGECCCFYKCKDCNCEDCDEKSKECFGKMVGKLNAEGINCKTSDGNGNDSLMCYLCVLKSSICKLKNACNVNSGSDASNGNLHQTLQKLPENIINVVGNICGNGAVKECCNKCTKAGNGNGCTDNGTCKCNGDKKCCEVNDRFSNFTKFLLGTSETCSTETSNNKCKTIAKTLTDLNTTLGKFINGNGQSDASGCTCPTGGGSANCTGKCCCGKSECKQNGCKENKPINILSCVINCGLKAIKERSEKIEKHIESIVSCLTNIQTKMCNLNTKYDGLHKCISELKECVTNGKSCIDGKICNLVTTKKANQGIFSKVINSSKDVLSEICGFYQFISIESYSYYFSPQHHPIFPHNKNYILPCINN